MDVIKKINRGKTPWQIIASLTKPELETAIQVAADAYYNSDVTLISDEIYDAMVDRLKLLEPKSKTLSQIGAPIKGKNKVELPYWMGSMDKIKNDGVLIKKWTDKYKSPYVVSDKLDGISCLLVMEDGEIQLFTRGDGSIGQNITHLVDLVNLAGDRLKKQTDKISIRGELIMSKENFEKYAKTFSNARNMVAGIVNAKDSLNKKYAADVDFVAYEIIEPEMKPSAQLEQLEKWKMNVVYWDIYKQIDLDILDTVLQKRKKKSIYEIDGVIITEDRLHKRNTSGNPSYSFAYKGMTETADVKVTEVTWRPSKDGIIVPTIHFEKVRLSQADLVKATGFNAKFIVDNKIGPDAIITVVRSGDVIPYVLAVVKPAKKPSLPDDLDYEWDDNGVNIVLKDAEQNETVIIQRLTKFMREIGVDNLSEGIVTKLVKAGYDNIPKIMALTVNDFLDMDGFKDTLANKLYNNLQDALNNLDMLTLMVASNVFGRGFGERKIKKILQEYPNIVEEYNAKKRDSWQKKLTDLEGFDTITVNSFLDPLPEFQEFYKSVRKLVNVKPYKKIVKTNGRFKNEIVIFTGFRSKDWQKIIEDEGGKVGSGVSRNSTLVVYNDGEENSSKMKKAKQLGIKTMSKSEFAKKYNL